MSKVKAIGTTLAQGATPIGKLASIGAPDKKADMVDLTTLDSTDNYTEFGPSVKTGGEPKLKGFFDSSDTGQTALETAFENQTLDTYTITYPNGVTWTFAAYISELKCGDANVKEYISFEGTFKITGKPVKGLTASTGMSAITITGTAGAMAPTFSIAKFYYTWSFTTDDAVTVTPTAASHTIDIYVNGVFQESVASGGTSGAIATFAAAGSKLIQLIVYEAGKSPKTYAFVCVRTS
jgi:hypothetical protein